MKYVNPFQPEGTIQDRQLFFNRTAELAHIWDALHRRSHVSIVGERRMGKSSLLWRVLEDGPKELTLDDDLLIKQIDLQLIESKAEFFNEMGELLELKAGDGEEHVSVRAIERALRARRLILLLDEFDRTAFSEAFPDDFFMALRGLCLSQSKNLSLVIATKLPLADFALNGMTSPFFNIFPAPITLKAFTEDDSQKLLLGIAAQAEGKIKLDPKSVQAAYALTEGVPWKLQLIGSKLIENQLNWKLAMEAYTEALATTDGRRNLVKPTTPESRNTSLWVSGIGLLGIGATILGLIGTFVGDPSFAFIAAGLLGLAVILGFIYIFIVWPRHRAT